MGNGMILVESRHAQYTFKRGRVSVNSNRPTGAVAAYLAEVTNDKRKIQASFNLLHWLQHVCFRRDQQAPNFQMAFGSRPNEGSELPKK
jgi:hypothetical protein